MEKEFYKLFLVIIMILASFSLAFFMGRKITLSDPHIAQYKNQNQKTETPPSPKQEMAADELRPESIAETQSQRKRVEEYKKQLAPEVNKKPKEDVPPAVYGLLADSFFKKDLAMEQAAKIKLKFPDWPVFFKKSGSVYKVYIGPFNDISSAKEFLQEVQSSKHFPSVVLEPVSNKKNKGVQ